MIYAIAFIVLHGCNPTLAALFAPTHPVQGRYEACEQPEAIDVVAAGLSSPQGQYTISHVELTDPLDALGGAGDYDRSRVVRLYGGSRPKVARGWRQDGDHFESVTLVSPYPNAALDRLLSGTLVIRWII